MWADPNRGNDDKGEVESSVALLPSVGKLNLFQDLPRTTTKSPKDFQAKDVPVLRLRCALDEFIYWLASSLISLLEELNLFHE